MLCIYYITSLIVRLLLPEISINDYNERDYIKQIQEVRNLPEDQMVRGQVIAQFICAAVKETGENKPVDIARDDNSSRVDGVTIVPWSYGRQLAWDATGVDPICPSNLSRSSIQVCSAAEKAVLKKRNDYKTVIAQYSFVATEPVDIARDDNSSRVDGVTIVPWSYGRQLAWDATGVDPICPSNLSRSSIQVCSAAEKAVLKKRNDYKTVIAQYSFVAFAVDCFGGWSNEAKIFAKDLGRRMANATGETKSLWYFRQRISLAIQRGNASSVLGTIPPEIGLNEIYYLR